MRQAAAELNFEEAANLRDRMIEVKKMLLDMECCQAWGCLHARNHRHLTTKPV